MFDVIIVGGGPAGLSAALSQAGSGIGGRTPRNERSRAVHGFLSRDGTPPKELLDCARPN
jgi:thioredoxin reductase